MKTLLRSFTTGFTAVALLITSVHAASPEGYVDFGSFDQVGADPYVEVDINHALLKLAAGLAKFEDPEIAEILSRLEHVHVNVIGLDDRNHDEATGRIEGIRAALDEQGWARIVTVREQAGDNVAVFIKQADDESIQGLVVTVIGGNGEAVLVNVVGDVRLEQIARLGQRLNLDPLRELNLTPTPVES